MGFVKLYDKILSSSVWMERGPTRLVWITMLVMADQNGFVEAAVPGLAHQANVSLEDCLSALEALKCPDPFSKSSDEDGRRVIEVDRGWVVVNHTYYRDLRTPEQVRSAERVAKWRAKQAVTGNDVTPCNGYIRIEAEAEAELSIKPNKPTPGNALFDRACEVIDHIAGLRKSTNPSCRALAHSKANSREILKRLRDGCDVDELKAVADGVAARVRAGKTEATWLNPVTIYRDSNYTVNLAAADSGPAADPLADEWAAKFGGGA